MGIPVHKRKFRSFISTAYVNRDFVAQIESWLVDKAGISVLHDMKALPSGTSIDSAIEDMLEHCQSMIILLTRKSIETGWVSRLFEAGIRQRSLGGNSFSIILIRMEECDMPEFLQTAKWIDMAQNGFDVIAASELLLNFYHGADIVGANEHDVFISRPWKLEESVFPNIVCDVVKKNGFRLIGNLTESSKDFEYASRVIPACSGFISIFSGKIGEKTKTQMVKELEIAILSGIPCLVLTENYIEFPELVSKNDIEVLIMDESDLLDRVSLEKKLHSIVVKLQEGWTTPSKNQYVFYGTDLRDEHKKRNQIIRRVIQQISAIPCVMGEDIRQGHIQYEIVNLILGSSMMIADISKENLNTCIEAGVSIGANVPVYLLSEGKRQKPPFMFRDRQIWHYENDLDLLGIVHKLILPYRRYIL